MMDLRRILASRVSEPIFWSVVKRYPVFDRLSEWRQRQWDDAAVLEARQARALGALLGHALARVPYYAERVPGLTPEGAAAAPGDSLARFHGSRELLEFHGRLHGRTRAVPTGCRLPDARSRHYNALL